jgi:tellurite resistance protein
MNFTEQLVAMMVAVLMADGKQEPEELEVVRNFAQDLELDKNEVEARIAAEIAQPQAIKKVARGVKKEYKETILEACVAVALADHYLCQSEIEMILEIADLLKIKPAKAILDIAAFVQNDRTILIEGNDALHVEDTIEIDE